MTDMATEMLSCETCVYRSNKSHSIELSNLQRQHTYHWIECHRYPPTVENKRPTVEPDDLCGEWSATFK